MFEFVRGAIPGNNKIQKITAKISEYKMLLVNTNKQRDSKETIEAVMHLKDKDVNKFNEIIN